MRKTLLRIVSFLILIIAILTPIFVFNKNTNGLTTTPNHALNALPAVKYPEKKFSAKVNVLKKPSGTTFVPYTEKCEGVTNPEWAVEGSTPPIYSYEVKFDHFQINCEVSNIAFDSTPSVQGLTSNSIPSGGGAFTGIRNVSLASLADSGLIKNLSLHIPIDGIKFRYSPNPILTSNTWNNFKDITINYDPQQSNSVKCGNEIVNPIESSKIGNVSRYTPDPKYSYALRDGSFFGLYLNNIFTTIEGSIKTVSVGTGPDVKYYKKLIIGNTTYGNSSYGHRTNEMKFIFGLIRNKQAIASGASALIYKTGAFEDNFYLDMPEAEAVQDDVFGMQNVMDYKKFIAIDSTYSYLDGEGANRRNKMLLRLHSEYISAVLLSWDVIHNQLSNSWGEVPILKTLSDSLNNDQISMVDEAIKKGKLLNFETSAVLAKNANEQRFKIPFYSYETDSLSTNNKKHLIYKEFFKNYNYNSSYSLYSFLQKNYTKNQMDFKKAIEDLPVLKWKTDSEKFKLPQFATGEPADSVNYELWKDIDIDLVDGFLSILTVLGSEDSDVVDVNLPYYRCRYNPTFVGWYYSELAPDWETYRQFRTFNHSDNVAQDGVISMKQLIGGVDAEYNDIDKNKLYKSRTVANPNIVLIGCNDNSNFSSNEPKITFYSKTDDVEVVAKPGIQNGALFMIQDGNKLDNTSNSYTPKSIFATAYFDNFSTFGLYNYIEYQETGSNPPHGLWDRSSNSKLECPGQPIKATNIIDQSYVTDEIKLAPRQNILNYKVNQNGTPLTDQQYNALANYLHSLSKKAFIKWWNTYATETVSQRAPNPTTSKTFTLKVNNDPLPINSEIVIRVDYALFLTVMPFFQKEKNYRITSKLHENYTDAGSSVFITSASPNEIDSTDANASNNEIKFNIGLYIEHGFSGTGTGTTNILKNFVFTNLGKDIISGSGSSSTVLILHPQTNFQCSPEKLKNIDFLLQNVFLFSDDNPQEHNKACVKITSLTRGEYLKIVRPEQITVFVHYIDDMPIVMVTYKLPQSYNPNFELPIYNSSDLTFWQTESLEIKNFVHPYIPPTPPTPTPNVENTTNTPVLIGVIAVSVVMLFIVIEIIVHKARKRKLLKEDEEDEKSLTVEKLDEKTGNNIKAKNNKDEELGLV